MSGHSILSMTPVDASTVTDRDYSVRSLRGCPENITVRQLHRRSAIVDVGIHLQRGISYKGLLAIQTITRQS
jgi:hypothetical protein